MPFFFVVCSKKLATLYNLYGKRQESFIGSQRSYALCELVKGMHSVPGATHTLTMRMTITVFKYILNGS